MSLTRNGVVEGRENILHASSFAVVVGGANIDIHGAPENELIEADSNVGKVLTCAGGVARNIAENLARLGAQTRLLAPIGIDVHGNFLHQQCSDAGIDMSYVLRHPTLSTSTYLSILNKQGDMQLAISDMEIINSLNPEYLRTHESMLKQANLMVIDCNLSEETLEYLLTGFPDQAKFVDAVSTQKAMKVRPFLNSIHTLKPTIAEAQMLANIQIENADDLVRVAKWFHDQGLVRLIISMGDEGVFYSTPQGHAIQNAINIAKPVNTAGAGDSFVAGLAYAWLRGWEIKRSIGVAQAVAAITICDKSTNSSALSIQQAETLYQENYARSEAE